MRIWFLSLFLLLGGCTRPTASVDGPIVLITIDALRPDAIGAFGGPPKLTPNLDAFAAESDWKFRAVSASSWTVPAMASLFTGLQPYRHQNWGAKAAVLRDELETLPEALAKLGYTTMGFHSNHWLSGDFGFGQGFGTFLPLREGKRAARELEALGAGKTFVWAHVLPPHAPYIRRTTFDEQVPAELRPSSLPERLAPIDLEPWFDPARTLPEALRQDAWSLYLYNVAYADQRAGQLLKALRRSGHWDKALVVVTSDHGEEFGEMGQVLHGGNLGRALVEVPLLVKWPRGGSVRPAPSAPVATQRLWSTLTEAAGRGPIADPAIAPPLGPTRDWPVLSELYGRNGTNQFSLVTGDRQLLWTSRFAPSEPDYYRARLASLGGSPDPPLLVAPEILFARLDAAFARTPPLAGGSGEPELEIWHWSAGGSERIEDPAEREALARRLRATWRERNGDDASPRREGGLPPDMSPEDLERLRALGYVAGGN